MIKKLGIDMKIDIKTVNNWIKYNNPWNSIIAFTTFYERYRKNNLKTELGIIRETAENILKGTYKKYRYDTEQLNILSEEQKEIWMKNNVTLVEEREVSAEAKGKETRLKEKIRDMVEHEHVKDEFIRNKLAEMLHNPIVNIEKLNTIIDKVNRKTKAGPILIEDIAKVQYFENVRNIESARKVLNKLHIIKTILALYNLSVEEIESGQIEAKTGKRSIVKITNNVIKSLKELKEASAALDMKNILDNIIQPTRFAVKGRITIEDTDDPFILSSIGEKPVSTCQGYNYPNIEYSRCLPAFLSDSNKKVVVVKRNGVLIARAVIRIMKYKEEKPVIFLEKIYTSTGEEFKKNILEHLLKKVERMRIRVATKLEVGGIDAVLTTIMCLESTGTRNEYEYSDVVKGKQKGIWKITGGINVLTPIVKEESEKWGQTSKFEITDGGKAEADVITEILERRINDLSLFLKFIKEELNPSIDKLSFPELRDGSKSIEDITISDTDGGTLIIETLREVFNRYIFKRKKIEINLESELTSRVEGFEYPYVEIGGQSIVYLDTKSKKVLKIPKKYIKDYKKSYLLAKERLQGLVADFQIIENPKLSGLLLDQYIKTNPGYVIVQEEVQILYDELNILSDQGKLNEAKLLLDELVDLIFRMWEKGVLERDMKFLMSFGINSSGDVVLFDAGKLSDLKINLISGYTECDDIKYTLRDLNVGLYEYYIKLAGDKLTNEAFEERWRLDFSKSRKWTKNDSQFSIDDSHEFDGGLNEIVIDSTKPVQLMDVQEETQGTVNEALWLEQYYQLIELLLEGKEREDYYKIIQYYEKINFINFEKQIQQIADTLGKVSVIYRIYGLGFPFYGYVDIRKRLYKTLLKFKDGIINTEELFLQSIPDIDLLIIYESSEEGPWFIRKGVENVARNNFLGQISFELLKWDELWRELALKFNLRYTETSIEKSFLNQGKLHVDLNPVPFHIWNNLPVFIELEDLKCFPIIHDILFTSVPIFEKDNKFLPNGIEANIPLLVRRNFILNLLEKGDLNKDELMKRIFVSSTIKNVLNIYKETRLLVGDRIHEALNFAKQDGLIDEINGNIVLLSKGKTFLKSVKDHRKRLFAKGFLDIMYDDEKISNQANKQYEKSLSDGGNVSQYKSVLVVFLIVLMFACKELNGDKILLAKRSQSKPKEMKKYLNKAFRNVIKRAMLIWIAKDLEIKRHFSRNRIAKVYGLNDINVLIGELEKFGFVWSGRNGQVYLKGKYLDDFIKIGKDNADGGDISVSLEIIYCKLQIMHEIWVLQTILSELYKTGPPELYISLITRPLVLNSLSISSNNSSQHPLLDGGKQIKLDLENFIYLWKFLAEKNVFNSIFELSEFKGAVSSHKGLKNFITETVLNDAAKRDFINLRVSTLISQDGLLDASLIGKIIENEWVNIVDQIVGFYELYFEDNNIYLFYKLEEKDVMVRIAADSFVDYLTDTEKLHSFFGDGVRVDILSDKREVEDIQKELALYRKYPELYKIVFSLNSDDSEKSMVAVNILRKWLKDSNLSLELKEGVIRHLVASLYIKHINVQRRAQKILEGVFSGRPMSFPEAQEVSISRLGENVELDIVMPIDFNPFTEIDKLNEFSAQLLVARNYLNTIQTLKLKVIPETDFSVRLTLPKGISIIAEKGIINFSIQIKRDSSCEWEYSKEPSAQTMVICQPDLRGKMIYQAWPAYLGVYGKDGNVRYDEQGRAVSGTFETVEMMLPYLKKKGYTHIYMMGIYQLEKPERIKGQVGPDASLFSPLNFTISRELGGEEKFKELILKAKDDFGIEIIVDIIPHVNQNFQDLPEWAIVKIRNDKGKIVRRSATDGSFNHEDGLLVEWLDSVMLNWRDKRVLDAFVKLIKDFTVMGVRGVRIDVAHNFGIMFSVDDSLNGNQELYGQINSRQRSLTGGFEVVNEWDANESNPLLLHLVSELSIEYPEFIFIGENYNKYIQLIKSGVIPIDSGTHDDLEDVIVRSVGTQKLNSHYWWLYSQLPSGAQFVTALSTHDYFQLMDRWQSFGPDRLTVAVWIWLFTSLGAISVYNRQEEGEIHRVRIDNYTYHNYDDANRQRYYAQLDFERIYGETIQNFYERVFKFYRENTLLHKGENYIVDTNDNRIFSIARYDDKENFILVANCSWETVSSKINLDALWEKFGVKDSREKFYLVKNYENGDEEIFTGEELIIAGGIEVLVETYRAAIISIVALTEDNYLSNLSLVSDEKIREQALKDALIRYDTQDKHVRVSANYAFVALENVLIKGDFNLFYRVFSQLAYIVEENKQNTSVSDITLVMHELAGKYPEEKAKIKDELECILNNIDDEIVRVAAEKLLRCIDVGVVVFVSSEATPISKEGGMSNVAGEFSAVLAASGLKVYIVTPLYYDGKEEMIKKFEIQYTGKPMSVYMGREGMVSAGLAKARINGVSYLLLDHPEFADILYGEITKEDEQLSSQFLSLGALEAMKVLNIYPNIVIGNDWMCAPLMAHLNSERSLYKADPHFSQTKTVGWIHNLGQDYQFKLSRYQGGIDLLSNLGLPAEDYGWFMDPHTPQFINYMAAFILHSNLVVSVSSGQMKDYLRSDDKGGAEGLNGILVYLMANSRLFAIPNGIPLVELQRELFGLSFKDIDINSPLGAKKLVEASELRRRESRSIVAQNRPEFWPASAGKSSYLDSDHLVVNMMSRVTAQKGIHFVIPFVYRILSDQNYSDVSFVFAGTGDSVLVGRLKQLVKDFPGRVGYSGGFIPEPTDDPSKIYHHLYCLGDIFIAFSTWEPGGISPMEALGSGVPCLVSDKQGLKSTVKTIGVAQFGPSAKENGFNGAKFFIDDWSVDNSVNNALAAFDVLYQLWKKNDSKWDEIRLNALTSDNSWDRSAELARDLFLFALTGDNKYRYLDPGTSDNDGGTRISSDSYKPNCISPIGLKFLEKEFTDGGSVEDRYKKDYKNRVIITGGAGYIGSHLVDQYLLKGKEVIIIDRNELSPKFAKQGFVHHLKVDILNEIAKVEKIIDEAPVVINLAGTSEVRVKASSHLINNSLVTAVMLELVKKYKKDIILISSTEVYGDKNGAFKEDDNLMLPLTEFELKKLADKFEYLAKKIINNHETDYLLEVNDIINKITSEKLQERWSYAVSKRIGEILGERYYDHTTILRLTNVYGKGQYSRVIGAFIKLFLLNETVVIKNGKDIVRTFMYIEDVVRAINLMSESKQARKNIFNIGSNY
ncbi:MAG: glycogen/starch synthase, partial [Candidatus Omnitrophica bacterium]|nr:glycogen/starch synthase [Candidatus Omnitrophota bacterium]